jgi:uncharacterized protein
MEIRHETRGPSGRFVWGEGSDEAEMTYGPGGAEKVLVFDHTYVPRQLRGRGIAEKLVEAGVAFARREGMTVVPACSYVRKLFERHPDRYADVRAGGAGR